MEMRRAGTSFAAAVLLALPGNLRAQGVDTTCPRQPPSGTAPFDTANVASLAGTYTLILNDTTGVRGGARTHRGRLTLWVPEAGVPGPRTPLRGTFDGTGPDTVGVWKQMASRDPEEPGVRWAYGTLRFGEMGDASGLSLTVLRTTGDSFYGSWARGTGMLTVDFTGARTPQTAGYFCASRQK